MKNMKTFNIKFEVIERTVCSACVEANTPKEALKLFKKNYSDYDSEDVDIIDSEIINGSEECVGEFITNKNNDSLSSLKRFDKPIKL